MHVLDISYMYTHVLMYVYVKYMLMQMVDMYVHKYVYDLLDCFQCCLLSIINNAVTYIL